ncbi:MAG: hypothetical protein EBZ24_09970 [Synechococcaceae bacterium WB9_4xB_025]|nr:hypothetical protein [Synechococcaceae bacterium WB9_4xB_025]
MSLAGKSAENLLSHHWNPWRCQLETMSMSLQLVVARGTARSFLSGNAAAGYGDVILLRRLLLAEGDHLLAADLLLMAIAMNPTPAEISAFGKAL